jgi:hypothetical protein
MGPDADPVPFREYLHGLRADGAALLVTGETAPDVRTRASSRFFGAVDEPHHRVLVCLSGARRPSDYLPPLAVPGAEGVVVLGTDDAARGATAAAVSPDAGPYRIEGEAVTPLSPSATPEARLSDDDPLAAIERALLEVLESLVPRDGDPAPSRLRVGVTSLVPVLGRADADAVCSFCDSVADAVRARRGTVHFHLPLPDRAARARDLAAVADARVELRRTHRVESLWHPPAYVGADDLDWLPL